MRSITLNVYTKAAVGVLVGALIGCSAQGLSTTPAVPNSVSPNAASAGASSLSETSFSDVADATDDTALVSSKSNVIRNGGFEDGRLHLWKQCDPRVEPKISKVKPFAGRFDADIDPRDAKGVIRDSQICQRIVVPADAVLTFHHKDVTNVGKESVSYWNAGLRDKRGTIVYKISKHLRNGGWKLTRVDIPKRFSGKEYALFFQVVGNGTTKDRHDHLYIDSVALVGSPVAPTPTPSPKATPTPVVTLNPPAITLSNVINYIFGPVTVEGLPAGTSISIASNSCASNVTPTITGNTVSFKVTQLFTTTPASGCTVDIQAAGVNLPLTIQIPLISFVGNTLPAGSSLVGNVLTLPNTLLSSLVAPLIGVSEAGASSPFAVVSDTCYSGNTLLGNLLAPVMETTTVLGLEPVTALLSALTGPATCDVVVKDTNGLENTMIVHIPALI
jgi:hypothetical protein